MNHDTIRVTNLVLIGHHGVFEQETRDGQRFEFDLEVTIDADAAAANDDYTETVCYGRLCDIVAEVSGRQPCKLVETVGVNIADAILEEFSMVRDVAVTIRKPGAPIAATFDTVGVTIRRKRKAAFSLSLGSNVGQKATNLQLAKTLLATSPEVKITKASRHFTTEPWGNEDQDMFLNACLIGETTLSPDAFLNLCKSIELQMGREPGERWGPRLIDIDILTFGDRAISTSELVLPHPEIFNRLFVLKPLADIAPDLEIAGTCVNEALKQLEKANPDALVEPVSDS